MELRRLGPAGRPVPRRGRPDPPRRLRHGPVPRVQRPADGPGTPFTASGPSRHPRTDAATYFAETSSPVISVTGPSRIGWATVKKAATAAEPLWASIAAWSANRS